VWRKCGYWKFQEKNGNWSVVHYEKSMPPLVLPALPKSYATTILVQCPRDEGMAPEHVKVMLAAQVGEIVTDDNTASHSF
jgi:hypothetical protein